MFCLLKNNFKANFVILCQFISIHIFNKPEKRAKARIKIQNIANIGVKVLLSSKKVFKAPSTSLFLSIIRKKIL